MRIVVTGTTGNTGSAVVRRPHAGGGHALTGPARRSPDGFTDRGAGRRPTGLGTETRRETFAEVPVPRPRTVRGAPGDAVRRGPVAVRRRP
ncbi:hypothetical protein CUT44_13555 [Streptomyces carminius]|uniref:NAD(P)-binding domain-containing protein n=1 Tax=Streptomyces carminius TaxID=2665496 RepID=A0A2M8LZA2_9ACTN|nr:hypothetical protein [Streptomyces carminius]PJE97271.1 hypothetical protein CUT44_13555 [Streptomyces carminius]